MNKAQAILSAVINRQIANGGEVIIEQPAAHVYKMKAIELENYRITAINAYTNGGESPYLQSSNSDRAWRIGLWKKATGKAAPKAIKPSRGHTWIVDDMKVSFGQNEVIERIN